MSKKITIELTEREVDVVLTALGATENNYCFDPTWVGENRADAARSVAALNRVYSKIIRARRETAA